MLNNWGRARLSDVAELRGGFAFKSDDYAPVGRFILRTLNIREDGSISRDDAVYLPPELCHLYSRFELCPDDTLFVMVGATLGKIGFVKKSDLPALLNQNMWLVRAKHQVSDPKFIHYAFRFAATSTLNWASGSARDFVRRDDYRNLLIGLPPIEEQRAIGHGLYSLDSKIESNRRMNETLEAMSRAIFKSWFADFDPVRAKAEGHKPFAMDADTTALFPHLFQDSPLGKIPKGWRAGKLEEIIDIHSGGTPKTSVPDYWGGDIPWFSVVDTPQPSDVFAIQTTKSITKAGVENSATEVLPTGTTIISARGTVGNLAVAGLPMAMNQSCYGIRGRDGFGDYFTYFNVKSKVDELLQSTHGTVFDTITRDTFKIVDCVVPPTELTQVFDRTVRPFLQRLLGNLFESNSLGQIRDALLPKLISGEIRMKAS